MNPHHSMTVFPSAAASLTAAIALIVATGCRHTATPPPPSPTPPAAAKPVQNGQPAVAPVTSTSAAPNEPADAQPPPPEPSTLQEYLETAALRNPELEAAFHRWKAALERIPQIRALPDPRFTYGYFIREIETRVGPQQQRFGIAQTFPWFGKLSLRGELETEEANAAYAHYEAVKLALFYRVTEAFHEFSFLRRAIAITEDNIQLLTGLEGVAQSKVRGGSNLTSVTKAQVELGKLDDRLRTLRSGRRPIVATLNAALNRPLDAPLPWPEPVEPETVHLDRETLRREASRSNPDLTRLEHLVTREEHAIRLARKDFFPDLTIGLDYTDTDHALARGVPDSGKDPVMASLSVNIPLWHKKTRAALAEARHRREAVARERIHRQNTLHADLELALHRFEDAERKINLYRRTLMPLARQSLNVARQSWEAGETDFLDLIDAERLLLEFQLEYERARTDRSQRSAEIDMLVGSETGERRTLQPEVSTQLNP